LRAVAASAPAAALGRWSSSPGASSAAADASVDVDSGDELVDTAPNSAAARSTYADACQLTPPLDVRLADVVVVDGTGIVPPLLGALCVAVTLRDMRASDGVAARLS
jgi:hypothetical protein